MPDIWPALPLLVGALLAGFTRGHVRAIVMLAAPILGALNVYHLDSGTHTQLAFLGQWLTPVRVDSLSLLFGYLFHLAALIGIIYALHLRDRLQQVAALAYAASAVGAVFAGVRAVSQ